jgi:hypothetical protein
VADQIFARTGNMYGISDDARIDAVITWVNGDDPAYIT